MMNVNDKAPLLSVIIPCWNGAEYIAEMLDSIISQSFTGWRCFLVDDRSTDNTVEIIKQYCKKDARFNLIVRDCEPKGAQTCRNLGFAQSEGSKYIIYLDCDDIIAPYCFEQRVEYMNGHQDFDYAIFPVQKFHYKIGDNTTDFLGYKWLDNQLEAFWTSMIPYVVISNIYRRDSLIKYDIIWDTDIKSMQDSMFNMTSLIKGLKYSFAENAKIDYYWRVVPNSSSVSTKVKSKAHLSSHIQFLNRLYSTMTSKQKRECKSSIEIRLINMSQVYCENKETSFFETYWLKSRPIFALKIKLLWLLGYKKLVKYILFPCLQMRYRRYLSIHRLALNTFKNEHFR